MTKTTKIFKLQFDYNDINGGETLYFSSKKNLLKWLTKELSTNQDYKTCSIFETAENTNWKDWQNNDNLNHHYNSFIKPNDYGIYFYIILVEIDPID